MSIGSFLIISDKDKTLADIILFPISSLGTSYSAEQFSPSRSSARLRSEGLSPIHVHIGGLEGDPAGFQVDYTSWVWISHGT